MDKFVTKPAEILSNMSDNVKILVDARTGVNYILYNGYGGSKCITPRYYADGRLVVDSQDEIKYLIDEANKKIKKPRYI